MKVISIGTDHTDKFINALNKFKNYQADFISSDSAAKVKVPVFSGHDEAEGWAAQNIEFLRQYLNKWAGQDVTFVVSQNLESGIFLVLLQICVELNIKVDVVLIRRDFGMSLKDKILAKVLYGVLYEFLNHGIDHIYFFYFDMFRKLDSEITLIQDSKFYSKIALLWHKKNVFSHRKSFLDLTGEVKWGITQINNILSMPKLVVLASEKLPEHLLTEINLEVFRMTYYISYSEEKVEESVEDYIREVSHVVRDFKFFSLGDDVLFELFVRPVSGIV